MSETVDVVENAPEAIVEAPEALPSAYLVSSDSHSPVAIEYLRDALRAAYVPVIELHHSVETIEPNIRMGNSPVILVSPHASERARTRYVGLGYPIQEISLTTMSVNNLRLLHGLEAIPSVTLGSSTTFPGGTL